MRVECVFIPETISSNCVILIKFATKPVLLGCPAHIPTRHIITIAKNQHGGAANLFVRKLRGNQKTLADSA